MRRFYGIRRIREEEKDKERRRRGEGKVTKERKEGYEETKKEK